MMYITVATGSSKLWKTWKVPKINEKNECCKGWKNSQYPAEIYLCYTVSATSCLLALKSNAFLYSKWQEKYFIFWWWSIRRASFLA